MAANELFALSKTTVVVVGAMNIHIFHPEWLALIDAISPKSAYEFEVNLSSPGFRLSPKKAGEPIWTIQPDRLVVESEKFDGKGWSGVRKVFERLPWTPVSSIGTNFHFKALRKENLISQALLSPRPQLPREYNMIGGTRSWRLSQVDSSTICNIQFSTPNDSISILINYHTDLTPFPPPTVQLEALTRLLSDFSGLREESESLARAFCEELSK